MNKRIKKAPYKKQISLLNHYNGKNYEIAEKVSKNLFKKYPKDHFSLKILSLVYAERNELSKAIEIAQMALTISLNKDPDCFNNLGHIFTRLGDHKNAEINYKKAIKLKPDFFQAYKNLGSLFQSIGKYEDAKKNLKSALEINDDTQTRHLLNSLSDIDNSDLAMEYAKKLHDDKAVFFDNLLTSKLEYKLPKIVTNLLTKNNNRSRLGRILDMGCGTGLFGEEIKSFCDYLEGVDISQSMLNEAIKKNVYDNLINRDIVDYLENFDLNFDIFISLDTFIYIGDINEIFELIVKRNKSKGMFIFSIELNKNNDKKSYNLENSGRYSHKEIYIDDLCKKFNYKKIYFEEIKIRKEKDSYIPGGLYILEF